MGCRKVTVTALEAEIVNWFRANDTLHPLTEVQEKFAHVPAEEVKESLDRLCELGILYGGETMILDLYGLCG